MKRFQFSLQGVLNYRTYLEQLAREETAKANLAVVQSKEKIEQFAQDLVASALQMDEAVAQGLSAAELRQYSLHMRGLESDIEDETRNRQKLEKELEEKRRELTRKAIEKKTMERLKEKQKELFIKEALLAEQKQMDEVSSLKTARESINEQE